MNEGDIDALRCRSEAFRRAIARRNLVELCAAALVVAAFTVAALTVEAPLIRWSSVAAAIGGAVVARTVWTHGASPVAVSEPDVRSSIDQHRAELQYQARLLERVPIWYLGPFVPSMAGFALDALQRGSWPLAVLLPTTFLGVWWLNRRGARLLREQAAALPTAQP